MMGKHLLEVLLVVMADGQKGRPGAQAQVKSQFASCSCLPIFHSESPAQPEPGGSK